MLVVLVHGYLAPGALLWPLGRQLERHGHRAVIFSYPSRRGTLDEHAAALLRVIREAAARAAGEPLAVFGHSLGGLLLHRVLADDPSLPVVRRVFAATPHRGCRLARRAAAGPLGPLLSPVSRAAMFGVAAAERHPSRTGVIIGTRDLMVRPDEADLPGAHDRLRLPYGHNEILLRPRTARAVARFLETGAFDPEPDWSLAIS